MDRSWTNASRMSPDYERKVEQFLEFALERTRPDEEENIFVLVFTAWMGDDN